MDGISHTTIPTHILAIFQGTTICITGLGFLLNLLVMVGIYRSRSIRSFADLALNLNLSLADLSLCLVWITTQTYVILSGRDLSSMVGFCSFGGFMLYQFISASVFFLLAIAIFHFMTIVMEQGLAHKLQVIIVIVFIWFLATFGSSFSYGLIVNNKFVSQQSDLYCLNDFTNQTPLIRVFNGCIAMVLMIAPLLLAVIYISIWKKLHKHKLIVSVRRMSNSKSEGTKTLSVNKMIIRRAIAVSTGFAFVYWFTAGVFAYQVFTGNKVSWQIDSVSASIVSLETVVNPILFLFLDIRCRTAVKELFGFIQRDRSEASSYYSSKYTR